MSSLVDTNIVPQELTSSMALHRDRDCRTPAISNSIGNYLIFGDVDSYIIIVLFVAVIVSSVY